MDLQGKGNPGYELKGRIDYVLGTPSLPSAMSDVSHIFHDCELTDHATTIFSIDFLPADKGYNHKSPYKYLHLFNICQYISKQGGCFVTVLRVFVSVV